MKKRLAEYSRCLGILLLLWGCGMRFADADTSEETRPAAWAQPVRLAGVPNLFKVSDRLYRSAQPTAEGMRGLEKMGIRTVISLRAYHTDKDEIGETEITTVSIPMNAWNLREANVVTFLKTVSNPAQTPALVHCMHGADRTGAMVAVYRVVSDGWPLDEAIREMTEGDFGYHPVWTNIVPFLKSLDFDAIKVKAGLGVPETGADSTGGLRPSTP